MTRHWIDSPRTARQRRENGVRCCSKTKKRNGGISSGKARKAPTCSFNYNMIWRSHRISKKNKVAADSTLLLLSHHFPALVVDWQRGNTFSAFPFIFLCSSVHSFYHITSYEKGGTKAHHISLRSFLQGVTCLRCAWELCCYMIWDFLGTLRTWSFCSKSTDIRTEGTWLIKQLFSHKIKDRKMLPDHLLTKVWISEGKWLHQLLHPDIKQEGGGAAAAAVTSATDL